MSAITFWDQCRMIAVKIWKQKQSDNKNAIQINLTEFEN